MKRECLTALALFTILAGFCGCGRELYPVGGTLVWEDGRPATELEGATIYFESAEHHSVSRSVVQDDGHFQLTTDRAEASGPDGVPSGIHRIYVVDGVPSMMKPHFRRPETSGLEVTVPMTGSVELRIERAPTPMGSTPQTISANENLKLAIQSAFEFVLSLRNLKWDQVQNFDRGATTAPERTLDNQAQDGGLTDTPK